MVSNQSLTSNVIRDPSGVNVKNLSGEDSALRHDDRVLKKDLLVKGSDDFARHAFQIFKVVRGQWVN